MDNLVEILQKADIEKGYYESAVAPYRKLLATKEGLEIIASDQGQSKKIIHGLFRRLQDVQKSPHWDPRFESKHLSPHVQNIRHTYLGNGSEGQVFRFYYPGQTVAVKFYKDLPRAGDSVGGIGQFLALNEAYGRTKFRTPRPYFATRFMCALEDFSAYPDYFKFIKEHPREKKRLNKYLEEVAVKSGFKIDTGDIGYIDLPDDFGYLEEEDEDSPEEIFSDPVEAEITIKDMNKRSSVFIIEHHPSKKKDEERYLLGTVDISL